MLYWNGIINYLAKILIKYEKIPGKKIIYPPRHYANCVSTTLMVLIPHNVESVYFFYSNPILYCLPQYTYILSHHNIPIKSQLVTQFASSELKMTFIAEIDGTAKNQKHIKQENVWYLTLTLQCDLMRLKRK
jgi:hypothetical protein